MGKEKENKFLVNSTAFHHMGLKEMDLRGRKCGKSKLFFLTEYSIYWLSFRNLYGFFFFFWEKKFDNWSGVELDKQKKQGCFFYYIFLINKLKKSKLVVRVKK